MFMEKFFTYTTVDPLAIELPEAAIWSRLGRNRFLSRIEPAAELKLKLEMWRAFEQCRPCGRWLLLPVTARFPEKTVLDESWTLESAQLSSFVCDAEYLWVGAVTIGDGIARMIAQSREDMSRVVVYDAVGSECADLAIKNLQVLSARILQRYNLQLSIQRFSIGYGALELKHQQTVFDRLKLEDLNMNLNESFIMQPEKSVTAFCRVNKIKKSEN